MCLMPGCGTQQWGLGYVSSPGMLWAAGDGVGCGEVRVVAFLSHRLSGSSAGGVLPCHDSLRCPPCQGV
jgi:hypothetical protein